MVHKLLVQKKLNPTAKSKGKNSGSENSKWESYFKNSEHTILVLDKKGIIRYKLIGPLTQEIRQRDLQPLIEQLRSE